jgi:molybdenum cofactor cytidylyltransferase
MAFRASNGMITAVVLAAGASSRMGRHKLLLPLDGEPLVRRTVRQICDAGFDDVLVVLGYEHEQVRAALAGLPNRDVVNAEYFAGMGPSFRTAVAHLPDSDAAMFALADQPFVTAREYRKVLDTYRARCAEAVERGGDRPLIVSVRYGDVTAPPHLFSRDVFGELAQLQHGARPVLERHRDRMVVLQFPSDLLLDVDTPEDYERAISRLSSGR